MLSIFYSGNTRHSQVTDKTCHSNQQHITVDQFNFAVQGGACSREKVHRYVKLSTFILVLYFPVCTDKLVGDKTHNYATDRITS